MSFAVQLEDALVESTAIFDGMLKLHLDAPAHAQVEKLLAGLPKEAIPIRSEVRHVSLIHQRILKPHRKELKGLYKAGKLPGTPPSIKLGPKAHKVSRGGRTSWFAVIANGAEVRRYVNAFMQEIGGAANPEPDRLYHVSIANLTGARKDSVGDVSKGDVG